MPTWLTLFAMVTFEERALLVRRILQSKDSITEDSSLQEYQSSFSLQTEMMSSAVDQPHASLH